MKRNYILTILALMLCSMQLSAKEFSVMTWNIWTGGNNGPEGVFNVEDEKYTVNTELVLKEAMPDILFMQETYCCGMESAKKVGYKHSVRGSSNLSIHSKYPIVEHIKLFKPFNSHGAIIDVEGTKVLCFNIWLHYLPDYFNDIKTKTPEELIAGEGKTRLAEIKQITKEIDSIAALYPDYPVVLGGDFNCGSHLDWVASTTDKHYGKIVEWPVSKHVVSKGFADSFREANTDLASTLQGTWGYLWLESIISDRIDFIYHKNGLKTLDSKIIMDDPEGGFFNSDHRAIKTWFKIAE